MCVCVLRAYKLFLRVVCWFKLDQVICSGLFAVDNLFVKRIGWRLGCIY